MILCRPELKQHIDVMLLSEFSIKIKIQKEVLAVTYLPPRLSPIQVQQILHDIGNVDYLVGDFNVRLGKKRNNDTTSGPVDRINVIDEWNLHQGFQFQSNHTSLCSRTDHLMAPIQVPLECFRFPSNLSEAIRSDHNPLSFVIALRTKVLGTTDSSNPPRYCHKQLRDPTYRNFICNYFDQKYGYALISIWSKLSRDIKMNTFKDPVSCMDVILNQLYHMVLDDLYDFQDQLFCRMEAVKSKESHATREVNSPQEAMVAYKRCQKSMHGKACFLPCSSSTTVADETKQRFENLYARHSLAFDQPQKNIYPEAMDHMTPSILSKALERLKTNKSCGRDMISFRIVKALRLSETFPTLLSLMFGIFYATGCFPASWHESLVHLIPKKGNDSAISNARPINLSQALRRIFESIILRRWMSLNMKWLMLSPCQAGFRRGYSTFSHILYSDSLSKQGFKYSAFLDLRSAYDKVQWSILYDKLRLRGIPDLDLQLISALLLHPASLTFSVNQSVLPFSVKTGNGLFQGSPLSPLLFTIFIDDLAANLPRSLLFADDIQLKSADIPELQCQLDTCDAWAKQNYMEFNVSKCGVVGATAPLLLDSESIPIVSSYKYLGFPHTSNGIDWALHMKHRLQCFDTSLNYASRVTNAWSYGARLQISRSYLRPVLEFGIPMVYVWAKQTKNESVIATIKHSYQDLSKFIFNSETYRLVMDSLTGLGDWSWRMDCLFAGLVLHLSRLATTNPLKSIMTSLSMQDNQAYLLFSFRRSNLLDQYRKSKREEPLSTWLKTMWLGTRAQTYGILAQYVLPQARDKNNAVGELFLPPRYGRYFVKWRIGTLFTYRKCVTCDQQFNRSHLSRCNLFATVNHSCSSAYNYYERNLETLNRSYPCQYKDSIMYTPVDNMLNNMDWLECYYLLSDLCSKLPSLRSQGTFPPTKGGFTGPRGTTHSRLGCG
jgi:hypothetical protein